jgi:Reverse transcriptase (RNA-dependent DNA polymerase).
MECLPLFKVPAKLIRLIELTQINTTERSKINNEYRQEFKVDSGLKQGDPLSTNLFIVVLDVILKQLNLRKNIPTR